MKFDKILYQFDPKTLVVEAFSEKGIEFEPSTQIYSFEIVDERTTCINETKKFLNKIAEKVKEKLYPFFKKHSIQFKVSFSVKATTNFALLISFIYEDIVCALEFRNENAVMALFNPDGGILVTDKFEVFDFISEFADITKEVIREIYGLGEGE